MSTHTTTAQSLSRGTIGAALLDIERAHNGTGPWEAAHARLTAAAYGAVIASDDASLFIGAPAVAFALHTAAAGSDQYAGALGVLDTSITALTRRRLAAAHVRIDRRELPRLGEFDLLYGLTGLGAYLLSRNPRAGIVHEVLTYLVRLTEPLPTDGAAVPGWWTTLDPVGGTSFPGGHGNLGMAHGITGPLAMLSLAARHGTTVEGHTDAILRICAWLDAQRQASAGGIWWPRWITRPEHHSRSVRQSGPGRPSWCYGTPGIARAQQLAGLALNDPARQHMAEDALLRCVTDPAQLTQITDAGLCHGAAGLLHTVHRVAQDARRGLFTDRLPALHALLLAQPPAQGEGLLEGTTGPALALQATTTNGIPASQWDTCLLLA